MILPSMFDDMCSQVLVGFSHLKDSSKVYIKSENYNIICYIFKNYFYKNNLKLGNCLYIFDSNCCRSIVFEQDDNFYTYFKSGKDKIEIVSKEPERISKIDLFNKSLFWNDDYYKLVATDKNISIEYLIYAFGKKMVDISSVFEEQSSIEFFANFIDNNLTRFGELAQLINFIMYSIVFNNDYKIYNFYKNNSIIGNIDLKSEVINLHNKLNELYNRYAGNKIQNFDDLASKFESMHLDEQYEYSQYFINNLIFTFRGLSEKSNKINVDYIIQRFFSD